MPACGETAILYFPSVKILPVGTYLWAQTYGYLKVLAFDSLTGAATAQNNCDINNAAPGTYVPACTCFLVGPTPPVLDMFSSNASGFSSITGNVNTVGSTLYTATLTATATNTSSIHTASLYLSTIADLAFVAASPLLMTVGIDVSLNGGAWATLGFMDIQAVAGQQGEQLVYNYSASIAPTAVLTVALRAFVTNVPGGINVAVSNLKISYNKLLVAV
jgi:hypothetical protein